MEKQKTKAATARKTSPKKLDQDRLFKQKHLLNPEKYKDVPIEDIPLNQFKRINRKALPEIKSSPKLKKDQRQVEKDIENVIEDLDKTIEIDPKEIERARRQLAKKKKGVSPPKLNFAKKGKAIVSPPKVNAQKQEIEDLDELLEARNEENIGKKYDPSCLDGIFKNIELKPAQTRVVKKLIDMLKDTKFHGLLVSHGTGTGKTEIMIGAIGCVIKNKLAKRIKIVTTKSLISEFEKRMKKYDFQIPSNIDFELITYDLFYRQYTDKKFTCGGDTFLIIDEVHNLRSPSSVRYKAIQDCAYKAKLVLALTATPFVNDYFDIVPLMRLIMREDFSNKFTDVAIAEIFEQPENYPQEIKQFESKLSWFYENNPEDFPKTIYKKVQIKMSPEYEKEYLKLEQGTFDTLSSKKDLTKFYTGLRITTAEIADLESTKFLEILKILDKKEQTVLYSEFIEKGVSIYIDYLKSKDISYAVITGSTPINQRKKAVDDYNQGKIKVLIISKAGELGLDLQNTQNIIFANLPWNFATFEQIIGRGVRFKSHASLPKSKRKVYIWVFLQTKSNENIKSPKKETEKKKKENIKEFASIDAYLWNLIQEKKIKKEKLDELLRVLSIK
jgi:superfamily II DNA or RNA helicase